MFPRHCSQVASVLCQKLRACTHTPGTGVVQITSDDDMVLEVTAVEAADGERMRAAIAAHVVDAQAAAADGGGDGADKAQASMSPSEGAGAGVGEGEGEGESTGEGDSDAARSRMRNSSFHAKRQLPSVPEAPPPGAPASGGGVVALVSGEAGLSRLWLAGLSKGHFWRIRFGLQNHLFRLHNI